MKIILTGGAGFIGSCYLWKLNSMGIDDVIVVDKAGHQSSPNLNKKKFKDYLSQEALVEVIEKGQLAEYDAIVHLGACADTTERDTTYLKHNNTEYSQILAGWCLEKNKRYHYASSASVYGDGKKGYSDNPQEFDQYKALNPYGESKRLFDQWVMKEGLLDKMVGFRYFNVFGPNEYHKGDMQSMISKAYKQIQGGGKVKLFASSREGYGDGSEERDFVYVKDICDVMAYFLENPDKNGIFNLGTGQARTFKDLVLSVFAALNKPDNIEYIPMPEKLKGQYQYFTQADLSNLKKTGYNKPFQSLENSTKDYVQNHLAQADPYL